MIIKRLFFQKRDINNSYKIIYDNLFKSNLNKKQINEHLELIKNDIKTKNETIIFNDNVSNIIKYLSVDNLLELSINYFLGSVHIPKSIKISNFFLDEIKRRNLTKDENLNLQFYEIFFLKLESMEKGNQKEYIKLNDKLYNLISLNNPLSIFNCGKELYFNAVNIENYVKKKEVFKVCYDLMIKSSENGFLEAFYYLGNIYEYGYIEKGIDLKLAHDFYLVAASNDNSQAYFKLSKFYKEGIASYYDLNLYYIYLKRSAELGLPEAMHNLGLYYLEKKENWKAFVWFENAGKNKFYPSLYNALKISIEILKNKEKADDLLKIIDKNKTNVVDLLKKYDEIFLKKIIN